MIIATLSANCGQTKLIRWRQERKKSKIVFRVFRLKLTSQIFYTESRKNFQTVKNAEFSICEKEITFQSVKMQNFQSVKTQGCNNGINLVIGVAPERQKTLSSLTLDDTTNNGGFFTKLGKLFTAP